MREKKMIRKAAANKPESYESRARRRSEDEAKIFNSGSSTNLIMQEFRLIERRITRRSDIVCLWGVFLHDESCWWYRRTSGCNQWRIQWGTWTPKLSTPIIIYYV